jgi:hypothetical protein
MVLLFLPTLLGGCNSNVDAGAGDSIVTGFISGLSADRGDVVSLGGRVTDLSTGEPISGARVSFEGVPEVFTDSRGYYSMSGILLTALLPAATTTTATATTATAIVKTLKITLMVSAENHTGQSRLLTLSGGSSLNQDFILTAIPPAALQGMVTDSGTNAGLEGVKVTIDGAQITSTDGVEDGIPGAFRFQNLSSGFHYVGFKLQGYVDKAMGVTLESGSNRLEVAMSPLAGEKSDLTGMVRDSRQGGPISGATVQIGTSSALTGDGSSSSLEGVFTIEGLTPGSMFAVVRATGFQTLVTGITVEKGVNLKDFTLTPDTFNTSVRGVLVGTAINSLGKLTSGVEVTVGAYFEDPREYRSVTGTDGWYTIRDIPTGTYVVSARVTGSTLEADLVKTLTISEGVNIMNLVFGEGTTK